MEYTGYTEHSSESATQLSNKGVDILELNRQDDRNLPKQLRATLMILYKTK